MLKSVEIRRQVAQRLRELLVKGKAWEEIADVSIAGQSADLMLKFRLGEQEHTVVVEVSSLGQPRQIRGAVTRLAEIRRELPGAYPVAAAVYIGPQSARILKSHNLGYVDLSGNCYLALENVLIEKEGKRNIRPSTRPLRSLFAPRATRVVRVLLVDSALAWVERDADQRICLGKPADLLESWSDSYTYRANEIASYVAPERITRRYMAELARAAAAEGRRYAFTLNAGVSLVAPNFRVPVVHCYLEGDPAPVARALGLRTVAEADGTLHVLAPYDPGVFYGALEKGGLKVVCLPQLYADLFHYERRGRDQAEHLRREAMGY